MKIVTVDRFWVGTGCAALGLAFLWSFVVAPKIVHRARIQRELAAGVRALQEAKEATPSRPDIESWSRYRSDLVQARSTISSFYTDNSKIFRSWFPDLPMTPDGSPARGIFVARYRDEAAALEARLAKASPAVLVGDVEDDKAPGFAWEVLKVDSWNAIGREDERVILGELQKRFWARHRVADLALRGRIHLDRIVDFRFARRLHDKFPEDAALRPGTPRLQESADPLPYFTFTFVVELPYSEVPRVIHEVLSGGTEAASHEGMLVKVSDAHLTICGQNPLKATFNYGSEEEKKAKEKEILNRVKPGKLRLSVTCQVLDLAPALASAK